MIIKLRSLISVIIDLLLINFSMFLAFMIRFDWQLSETLVTACIFFMIAASIIKILMLSVCGIYQWAFRYASISEAINLLKAVTFGSLLLVAVAFFTQSTYIGRSVLLIDYLIYIFLVTTSRFSPRALIKFRQGRHKDLTRVLIVGAGSSGEMVARELLNVKDRIYDPIGFIDDDPLKLHHRMHGRVVLGVTGDMANIVEEYNIEEIIIAIPSASGNKIREIVSKCEKPGIKIKIAPGLHDILTGETAIKQIRDVELSDLLGRETVQINNEDVSNFLKEKVVLVTGAGGSIGSELCRQIMKFDPRMLILFDHAENETYFLELDLAEKYPSSKFTTVIGDIKDIGLLKNTFTKYKPQIVFHSAAHKHVPLMEENPAAAVKNNIIGTRNFMYAAEHYKVERFVMISTDKAVNPTSVMGASKRIAEMIIQAKAQTARTKFMAVRFGNVLGSSGSVVPIFKQQIEKGGPVTVTHPDVKRYFMTASEAAQLVIQAGAIGNGGEVFILDMGEQIKISDLAKNLITLSGLEPGEDIEIKYIGLRPGEKMHEEMLLDREHDKATKNDKIFITQPDNLDSQRLRKDIKTLERLSTLIEGEKIIKKIQEMVTEFRPGNSD